MRTALPPTAAASSSSVLTGILPLSEASTCGLAPGTFSGVRTSDVAAAVVPPSAAFVGGVALISPLIR